MAYRSDPEGNELKALHTSAKFDDARVLEVGSGDGRLLFRYAASTSRVIGFDPNVGDLAKAVKNRPDGIREKVSFLQARTEELPFPDREFDIALFAWSL